MYSVSLCPVFRPPDVMDLRCALLCRSLVKAVKLTMLYINIGEEASQIVLDGIVKAKLGRYITVHVPGR